MSRPKPRLLYIAHSFFNRAGVEEHLRLLLSRMALNFEVLLVFPEREALWLLRPNQKAQQQPAPSLPLLAPQNEAVYDQFLERVLEEFKPDLVHLAHFAYWPLSLLIRLTNLSVPLVVSFHDYYALTPAFTMQGGGDAITTTTPAYAKLIAGRDVSPYLRARRQVILKLLENAGGLVVPSEYLADQLFAAFPFRYEVIPYGIEPQPNSERIISPELCFGYFGGWLPQKGYNLLLEAFKIVNAKYPLTRLLFCGGGGKTRQVQQEGVEVVGGYDHGQLPSLLARVAVGVIPSIFPETYSIILSELWQAGIPAVVSDIGALGVRVIDGVNGKVSPPGNVAALAASLSWFCEHNEWRSWKFPVVPSANDMALKYLDLYTALLNGENRALPFFSEDCC